jgi:hypothetical protein
LTVVQWSITAWCMSASWRRDWSRVAAVYHTALYL